MGSYPKAFILVSLVYLTLAAIFAILGETTDIGYIGHFSHTNFNLLGFISMMMFGIGYIVIPGLNRTVLRFPRWVPLHFWLGNVSLLGMVLFRSLAIERGSDFCQILFVIAASLQIVTILMFIFNIWFTLTPTGKNIPPSTQSGAARRLSSSSREGGDNLPSHKSRP